MSGSSTRARRLEDALAPGSARRRALDAALAEVEAGRKAAVARVAAAVLAAARARAAAVRGGAAAGRRHGAVGPPGRRAVRHADRAARRGPAQRQRRRPANGAETADELEAEPRAAPSTTTIPRRGRGRRTRTSRSDEAEADGRGARGLAGRRATLDEDVQLEEQPEDPNADRRFWFEHATGAGKTVAALGFVEASRTGGVLILTHRRNLVDQFIGELTRPRLPRPASARRCSTGQDAANGPVTVETYQWFVRNAGKISDAYTIVICDEAHTALGEKTSAAIRSVDGPDLRSA